MDDTWTKTRSDFGFLGKIRQLSTLDIITIMIQQMQDQNNNCWNFRDLKYLTLSLIYTTDYYDISGVVKRFLQNNMHEILL